MKWTLMNTPFAKMLYIVARPSRHLFPSVLVGLGWSKRGLPRFLATFSD